MTDLSPAAQAIVNAAIADDYGRPTSVLYRRLATALRAAADQVVPKRDMPVHACLASETAWLARAYVRKELLAIATELEGCTMTDLSTIAETGKTMKTKLSPAAQAIRNAAIAANPGHTIAAALRAAADQFFTDWDATRCCVFLDALADELESQ